MTYMLCRNRVEDYARWRAFFDVDSVAHRDVGLTLRSMWHETGDPNNVFFLLEVADVEGAKAFVSSPDAAKTGKMAGVIDGEVVFVERIDA